MKDIKILGLVIVCLFLVFLISGGITGSAFFGLFQSKTQRAESISTPTYSIPTSKGTSGCIELTDDQCSAVCGQYMTIGVTDTVISSTWGCISFCKNNKNDCADAPHNCRGKTGSAKDDCCHSCCWGGYKSGIPASIRGRATMCDTQCLDRLDGTTDGQLRYNGCWRNCMGIVL